MKIFLTNRADVQIFCDDKRLPVRKEKGMEYVETGKANGEQVTLRLVRRHELSRPLWLLYAFVFWTVGIFGFFTPRYSPFTPSLDCSMMFFENDAASLRVRFTHYLDETGRRPVPAVTELTGFAYTENPYYQPDPEAKRRRKLYKLFSWLGRLAVIVAIAAIIFIINS